MSYWMERGRLVEENAGGDLGCALENYRQALEFAPERLNILESCARLLEKLGRYEECRDMHLRLQEAAARAGNEEKANWAAAESDRVAAAYLGFRVIRPHPDHPGVYP